MNKDHKTRRRPEKGIALLIAIFVLLLISVVAIALLVSSGTETALGANYRNSSTVYYAALAGLEEARGRLIPKNPNYFTPAVIPTPFPLGQTVYMLNRLSGENVVPWDSSNQYYDKEYGAEFFPLSASSVGFQPAYSVWDYTNSPSIPGPIYKWVRITAATEQSLYLDVDSDGSIDSTPAIYYNPAQLDSHGNPAPGLIVSPAPPPNAVQVLQITALAYLPNGSQKLLQYLVAPVAFNLNFPAALTLDGNQVTFSVPSPPTPPAVSPFWMNGNDQFGAGSCTPGPSPVYAVGYTNNSDTSRLNITGAIFDPSNFIGSGGSTPNVRYVGGLLSPALQTVGGLNSLVQNITQNADVVLDGTSAAVMQSDAHNVMPAWMSPTNPVIVVVNGDLTFNGWHSAGYGILLVTGQFTFDPDASWNGIVLVIGTGEITSHGGGNGQFNGAMLLASTVDGSGNPLLPSAPLGQPSFNFPTNAGSNGIYYSSCWVNYVQTPVKYKVLSFHEIPQ